MSEKKQSIQQLERAELLGKYADNKDPPMYFKNEEPQVPLSEYRKNTSSDENPVSLYIAEYIWKECEMSNVIDAFIAYISDNRHKYTSITSIMHLASHMGFDFAENGCTLDEKTLDQEFPNIVIKK
mgnify:CR=1 FL=1